MNTQRRRQKKAARRKKRLAQQPPRYVRPGGLPSEREAREGALRAGETRPRSPLARAFKGMTR